MKHFTEDLSVSDTEIFELIDQEKRRLDRGLELIASENLASRAVLQATGSVLTNKYSEGYPGRRYYGGNEVIDKIEQLAIDRAKELFGCQHANMQPYSGSIANLQIYSALLEPGDRIMGMNLAHGGHLTHGHPVNLSGRLFKFSQYGVDRKTQLIDYDEVLKQAKKERPKVLLSGATAYPRIIDFKMFEEIGEQVGATSMADISHVAGLIVGGEHPSPFPEIDVAMTTTHKTLRGPRGAIILCKSEYAQRIDKAVFPGMQGGPSNHITAAKAVAFKEASTQEFKDYIRQVVRNAKALADELLAQGMTLVSGGTDNHLILMDLTKDGVTGKEAEKALDRVCITVNKNMVPYDTGTPFDPSGIRIGTPAVTTRGMKEGEMKDVGQWIAGTIKHIDNDTKLNSIRRDVCALCDQFPLYKGHL